MVAADVDIILSNVIILLPQYIIIGRYNDAARGSKVNPSIDQ